MSENYNGWSNYETWLVKLWMDNDEMSCDYWIDVTRRCNNVATLADFIKEFYEECRPELEGIWSDLISAALSEVDWYEIAKNMKDDE